jgi:hypothetical protein
MKQSAQQFLIGIVKEFCVYTLLFIGTLLMTKTIALYTSGNTNIGFLTIKQNYIHNQFWLVCFYIHVFTSIFLLLAGFTQFNSYVLTHHKKLHHAIGKWYVGLILFVNFPTGLIMAIYANGFLPSKIAFVILDVLWFWFTLKALLTIKQKNVQAHKNFMIRSYALTCSAITLRTWKLIINAIIIIDPTTLYMIDAWLGFVPNLLFAEWMIRRNKLASA